MNVPKPDNINREKERNFLASFEPISPESETLVDKAKTASSTRLAKFPRPLSFLPRNISLSEGHQFQKPINYVPLDYSIRIVLMRKVLVTQQY